MANLFDRYGQAIVVGLAALLAAALVTIALERRDGPQPLEIVSSGTPTPDGPIEVYITGAVSQPGVYEISADDRVVDLLYLAGGQTADADLEAINLATRLHDEDRVIVPRIGQTAQASSSGVTSLVAGSVDLININSASAAELDALPGIGEVYSQRIVDSRTALGLFATTDDLVNREIIPRGTYEKIRELITTGP